MRMILSSFSNQRSLAISNTLVHYYSLLTLAQAKGIREVIDVPRKPPSSYNLFVKDQMKCRPDKEKVSVTLKRAGQEWKSANDATKKGYEDKASHQIKRYYEKKTIFEKNLTHPYYRLLCVLNGHELVKNGRARVVDLPKADRHFAKQLPSGPIASSHALFISKYYKSGKKDPLVKVNELWNALGQKEKNALAEMVKNEPERFANDLKKLLVE